LEGGGGAGGEGTGGEGRDDAGVSSALVDSRAQRLGMPVIVGIFCLCCRCLLTFLHTSGSGRDGQGGLGGLGGAETDFVEAMFDRFVLPNGAFDEEAAERFLM